MSRIKQVVFFLLVLGFLFVINEMLHRDLSKPNDEFLPDMVYSVAYDSFSPNPNFPDGKTLQVPVKGTIPRGYLPEYTEGTLTEEKAGIVLSNPYKNVEININQGEKVYKNFCFLCHGESGKGNGPVIKKGFPPPPSLISEKIRQKQEGRLYFIISNGKGNMAPYKFQISRNDRWKVVLYIKSLGEKINGINK